MNKKILLDYSLSEFPEIMEDMGIQKYQCKQIYDWLVKGRDFCEMSNISKRLRLALEESFVARPIEIIEAFNSKDAEKYLYKLADGNIIEGIVMGYSYGRTLCVSTQVGCRMGCKFCASTVGGMTRNLSAGEIVGQVTEVNRRLCGEEQRAITNLVLMGSGEPLDNYENTVRFLDLITSDDGLNFAARNISLSTCGIVPKMYELAEKNMQINLTVSLHSPFDETRETLMPTAATYKVADIVRASREYFNKTGRRVIFEYILVENLNDNERDAKKLSELLRGFSCHINLIRLNSVKESRLKGSSLQRVKDFQKMLETQKLSVSLRRSLGSDIAGACGQLRRKFVGDKQD